MNKYIRKTYAFLNVFGIHMQDTIDAVRNTPRFIRTCHQYKQAARTDLFPIKTRYLFPKLTDFDAKAGSTSGHYFHQDLWAARKIYARAPRRHVDIGSRVDGFVAHCLVFMPVEVIDIRPLDSTIDGLHYVQEDATEMATFDDNSIESLSSLHAVEHFGLGRYGDSVDPNACFVAMRALARVLKPGGRLYFSVPIGRQRLAFNAHRIFAPDTILDTFAELTLVSFSAVNDDGELVADAEPNNYRNSRYSAGLFEFTK